MKFSFAIVCALFLSQPSAQAQDSCVYTHHIGYVFSVTVNGKVLGCGGDNLASNSGPLRLLKCCLQDECIVKRINRNVGKLSFLKTDKVGISTFKFTPTDHELVPTGPAMDCVANPSWWVRPLW